MARTIVIMGAAGRDFHNFNVQFRNNADVRVAAFTATQIPDIDGRIYPAALAGPLYPQGIPVLPEEDLPRLIREEQVDEVIFSYSDVSHETVMHRASLAAAGTGCHADSGAPACCGGMRRAHRLRQIACYTGCM
jgi:predicted GTPase